MVRRQRHAPAVDRPQVNVLFFGIASAALAYGVYSVYQLRWLCDDIFITFRYVQNWREGLGIVYNVGERVEGYTHFLWMCLIALFQWLGSNPRDVVYVLGIGSFALTLVAVSFISWRASAKVRFFPLATVLLAINYDFKVWATSGLETSLFTLLVVASALTLIWWKQRSAHSLLITGLLMTFAVMTRPDGILFAATTGIFILVRSISGETSWRTRVRQITLYLLPCLVIYLPYLIWKYLYYGDIFPNTYYAKSGALSYFSQGWVYVWMYLQAYIVSSLALLGFAALGILWRRDLSLIRDRVTHLISEPKSATVVLSLAFILVYGIEFIVRVGGDFMYARFLHPLIPFIALVIELSLISLLGSRRRTLLALMLVLPLCGFYENARRDDIFVDDAGKRKASFINGITDEHWYWTETEQIPVNLISMYESIGEQLSRYFQGEQASVLLRGQASLGYYAKFAQCIENSGLTDSYIAHMELTGRSRPGHEKQAPLEYLVSRDVNFVFTVHHYDTAAYRNIVFNLQNSQFFGEILTYDRRLMRRLREKLGGIVDFVDFEQYLDQYLSDLKKKDRVQVGTDYVKFKEFYFHRNSDPQRELRFKKYLGLE